MGRRKRKAKLKRKRPTSPPAAEAAGWLDQDGVHAVLPGRPPDQATLDRMTQVYQQEIRNSPMWDEMVRQFGREKAEELLRQCRAELR